MEEDRIFLLDDKKSLVNVVINAVLDGIRTHKYKSGDRLPSETAIMKEFEVSRGTVREAMKVLSALGVISIKRGEGTFIAEANNIPIFTTIIFSLLLSENKNVQNILDFRLLIDDLAVEAASMRCTEEDIEGLEKTVSEMRELYEEGKYELIADKDMQFHMDVVNYSKNPFLINLLTGLYKFFGPEFVYKSNNKNEFNKAEKSHKDVIQCLRTRDYNTFIKIQRDNNDVLTEYFK